MKMLDVVEEVVVEAPALTLSASNAVGESSETPITWAELARAEIGHTWQADGGGELFWDHKKATLVYRDGGERVAIQPADPPIQQAVAAHRSCESKAELRERSRRRRLLHEAVERARLNRRVRKLVACGDAIVCRNCGEHYANTSSASRFFCPVCAETEAAEIETMKGATS